MNVSFRVVKKKAAILGHAILCRVLASYREFDFGFSNIRLFASATISSLQSVAKL